MILKRDYHPDADREHIFDSYYQEDYRVLIEGKIIGGTKEEFLDYYEI